MLGSSLASEDSKYFDVIGTGDMFYLLLSNFGLQRYGQRSHPPSTFSHYLFHEFANRVLNLNSDPTIPTN